jgi:hypothetical protein
VKCCVPAPPVIEFDQAGKVVQGWGGDGPNYKWGNDGHGIHVDHNNFVWVGDNVETTGGHIYKFTRDGKFALRIGEPGPGSGSNDTKHLGRPAEMVVDRETNELFVADGYGNKRVIVFDATTGAYKRHWGAYGKPPSDEKETSWDQRSSAPPPTNFTNPVHCITITVDGLCREGHGARHGSAPSDAYRWSWWRCSRDRAESASLLSRSGSPTAWSHSCGAGSAP